MTDAARLPPFTIDAVLPVSAIGGGAIGGKASGLLRAQETLAALAAPLEVFVPRFVVVGAAVFEEFVRTNHLGREGAEREVALAFQHGELPAEVVGALWALAERTRSPLAVRSSSVLEDARAHPFAGVYATKLVPGHDPSAAARFRQLVEALKLVWASAFFPRARTYARAVAPGERESMAVVIQEVVGRHHGPRFYPDVSAVARSVELYPAGGADPEEGGASLALGLGKTIVDGGRTWPFCPRRPAAPPPFGTTRDLLDQTQRDFWAVHMGPLRYDPLAEDEHLVQGSLADAERDGTVGLAASTYLPASDRLVAGIASAGLRVLTFAPLLAPGGDLPFAETVAALLAACARAEGSPVEIELALVRASGRARLGLVQVRPMPSLTADACVSAADLADPRAVAASTAVLGHGTFSLHDVVYVRPDAFERRFTREVAAELAVLNAALVEEGRPYLVVGLGRWGTSDPWLGIPADFADVSGARVFVEAALPGLAVEPSLGAHFFHNLVSIGAVWLGVREQDRPGIDWAWLASLPVRQEGRFVRAARCAEPVRVRVDGRQRRGVVLRP